MIQTIVGIVLIVGGLVAMIRGFFIAYEDALNSNLDEKTKDLKSNRLENYSKKAK